MCKNYNMIFNYELFLVEHFVQLKYLRTYLEQNTYDNNIRTRNYKINNLAGDERAFYI